MSPQRPIQPCPPPLPKPSWIRVRMGAGDAHERTRLRLRQHGLHTVCEEALCPNRGHCWSENHATVLILGAQCTRACRFCHVEKGLTCPPDPAEPARVAAAVAASGLREVVLTSVTRDDLPDGGAALWAETVRRVRQAVPGVFVEVLVPDFGGARAAWQVVFEARPDILGHNLETVPRLYPLARPEADYARSLALLAEAAGAGLTVKTSLMLGMGETDAEVSTVMRDARAAGVHIFFAGQYLQPTRAHLPVARYLPPEAFAGLAAEARRTGFGFAACAPLVRSSYREPGQIAYARGRKDAFPPLTV